MSLCSSGEILTLQFGHYSNFIGTHWWNIQENGFEYSATAGSQDINHDVLYREGVNDKGQVTFTPRLLLVDLKGSLRACCEKSDLYDTDPEFSQKDIKWDTKSVEVKKEKEIPKNKFQQETADEGCSKNEPQYKLEDEVKVWSDFLYSRFHPRTLNIVKEYQHQEDSMFNTFSAGTKLWNSEQFTEDFSDKIRNYVEECDFLQGYQVLLDAVDGFSGLSASCIEHLKDEYGRTTVAIPTIPSFYSDYKYTTEKEFQHSVTKDSIRVLNIAFCFNSLRENASLFIPLCSSMNGWRQPGEKREFYHTKYNPELYYHSGAILASALDTFSLKYRLKTGNYTLQDLGADLTSNNRIAAAASLCLPFSLNYDSDLIQCLDNWTGPITQSITPSCKIGTDEMVQIYTLRGVPENRLKKPLEKAGSQKDLPAYKCKSLQEMLEFYLACTTFTSINNATVVGNGLTVKAPYPSIFDEYVGQDGNIMATPRSSTAVVQKVPVLSGLHNGPGVGEMLESLHKEAKKIKLSKFHQFKDTGVEMDDFVECLDSLVEFRECYENSYFI